MGMQMHILERWIELKTPKLRITLETKNLGITLGGIGYEKI